MRTTRNLEGSFAGRGVKQFWEETDWRELDFMIVDLPPGTGCTANCSAEPAGNRGGDGVITAGSGGNGG